MDEDGSTVSVRNPYKIRPTPGISSQHGGISGINDIEIIIEFITRISKPFPFITIWIQDADLAAVLKKK